MELEQVLRKIVGDIESGDITSAEVLIHNLPAKIRNNPEVLFLAGCIEYKKSDYERAIHTFKKVLQVNPRHRGACQNLSVTLNQMDRSAEAIIHLSKFIVVDPMDPVAYYNLGNAYWKCKRLQEAKEAYLKSVSLNPHNHLAYNHLGIVCKKLKEIPDAIKYLLKAININPSPDYYFNLLTLLQVENLLQAYMYALEAIELKHPGDILPLACAIFLESCRWDMVEAIQERVLEYASSESISIPALQHLLLTINSRSDIPPDKVYELHRMWGRCIAGPGNERVAVAYAMPACGKLRIGYLSGDFCQHPVGLFIRNIIAAHDPEHFEIYCYSTYENNDDIARQIMQSARAFVNVESMTSRERARKIFEDGIHILVDLAGHTTHTGLAALKYRPAPVQVTYLGYPNTTGLTEVDFRITDQYAESEYGMLYTEELLKMPESFLCFGAFAERPIHQEPPCHDQGCVTFASFNDLRKLSADVIRIWAEILARVPGARLMIKAKKAAWSHVQENIIAEFSKWGVEKERLSVLGHTPEKESHFDMYNQVDIALDTFPYNGTTTTCEALWMGVPVVTLLGKVHAQRVSYSLLKNIGIEDTITHSEQEYINVAVNLATDRTKLQDLRARLPAAIRGSILCDPVRFTRQLEALYCEAWKRKGYELPFYR